VEVGLEMSFECVYAAQSFEPVEGDAAVDVIGIEELAESDRTLRKLINPQFKTHIL
jgi:hypothetical protein